MPSEDPPNISWGDGSPVEFRADSPDLVVLDPFALDSLVTVVREKCDLPYESLRSAVLDLCQETGIIAHYAIDNFSPGLYRLDIRDIRKFGSDEEEMSDEEWAQWQADQDEPGPGPPRYVGVDSAAIIIADMSHLRELTKLLTWDTYDRSLRGEPVFPQINEALGGPYYAVIHSPGEAPGIDFDGDGTYTIRAGAIRRVDISPRVANS